MERSFIKGLAYLEQNQLAEASVEFKKVLRVFPKYEPIYLNMADYWRRNGRPKASKAQYNYSKKLCLINAEIFSERGLVYAKYNFDHLDKGVAFYNDHVLKNYPSNLFYAQQKK